MTETINRPLTPQNEGLSSAHARGNDTLALRRVKRPLAVTIQYLTQEELRRFFDQVAKTQGRDGVRDQALFHTIYRYGLRVSEALGLLLEDLSLEAASIRIHALKGGIAREYPLEPDLLALLGAWLRRHPGTTPWLFPSRRPGRPLTRQRVHQIFQRYAGQAGLPLKKRHVHCLRHTICTHLLDAGLDLRDTQEWVRHRRIESTVTYAQLTAIRRQAVVRKIHSSPMIVRVAAPSAAATRSSRSGSALRQPCAPAAPLRPDPRTCAD